MRFWHSPKPTIAAVQGACLAGGCELALACDITVAAEDAIFGEPELRFGAGIVVMLLPWLVGPKRAKQVLLTGEDRIDARRAEAMGLVNEVVATGGELARALAIAGGLAEIDVMALRETKRAINRSYEIMGLGDALEAALDIDLQIEGQGTEDKRRFLEIAREQGLRAAIAWRDARFAKH
jgi:enoyl-CoA hydratase/carnithine racemase